MNRLYKRRKFSSSGPTTRPQQWNDNFVDPWCNINCMVYGMFIYFKLSPLNMFSSVKNQTDMKTACCALNMSAVS